MFGNDDYTEYTALQSLALNAPDIPAPKPHGLVKFHGVRIMFMTYFPSMTLTKAWPQLTPENKSSIQDQLEGIFWNLRKLKMPPGHYLGEVNGEGVKDYQMGNHEPQQVNTNSAFEEFQFSINTNPPSPAWIKLLKSFLPPSAEGSVFTHGDVRPQNIMVKEDGNGKFVVSGIIDWE